MTREGGWLDVSLPIRSGMPIFPGDPDVVVETVTTQPETPYHVSRMVFGSHTGTHVDAPAHFIAGGTPLTAVPLSRWSGPCWVLEAPAAEAVTRAHCESGWPDGPVERVLFKTPNSELWDTPKAGHEWQALAPEAAEWLVAKGVRLIGIDALSIEKDDTGEFPVHHTLLGNDVLIVEGLDLRGIAPGPYEMVCMPLRLDVPDGAPARVALKPLK